MIKKGMADSEYRKMAGVTQSDLKNFKVAPGFYRYRKNYTQKTAAMALGTAVHSAILTPDLFDSEYIPRPEGLKLNTKEGMEWKKEIAKEKQVLTEEDSRMIDGIRLSIRDNKDAQIILANTESEVSFFAEYMGVRVKGRVDGLNENRHYIFDLKTTNQAINPKQFERTIYNYGYYLQGAFYLMLSELSGINIKHFCIIVVQKTPPYPVAVYRLGNLAVDYGRREIDKLISEYKKCEVENKWPFYEGIHEVGLPNWVNDNNEIIIEGE